MFLLHIIYIVLNYLSNVSVSHFFRIDSIYVILLYIVCIVLVLTITKENKKNTRFHILGQVPYEFT